MNFQDVSLDFILHKLFPALIVLAGGYVLMMVFLKVEDKLLSKSRHIDPMLFKFIRSATKVIFWAVIVVEVLTKLGIDATSIITVFAAAGAAVALALQGSLSNLAGGILMMFTKQFSKGDYILCNGVEGTVDSMDLLYTTIITADGKIISVPNANLTANTITNFTRLGVRRVEIKIGISYDSDIDSAKYSLVNKAKQDKRFLDDRPVTCDVLEYASSSVILVFRGWVRSEDYWNVFFEMNDDLKNVLKEAGAEIPYPRIDIHSK